MGIYDRDYYQRQGPGFLGSFSIQGRVCKWLILINIIMFVLQLATGSSGVGAGALPNGTSELVTDAFMLDPASVVRGQVWRLLTYAFLHATLLHIAFNMLFLWWFGHEIEEMYGPREFLAFYLVSALVGGVVFTLFELYSGGKMHCIGASGAVTAILTLYAFHFPRRVIYIWFILPVPIWAFVLFEVAQDLYTLAGGFHSVTAVTVHLAGAAFAAIYYKMDWRLMGFWRDLTDWWRRRSGPRLRIHREEELPPPPRRPSPRTSERDDQLEAKVDAVLEKVARYGQASLSESEKQLLMRASEIYKRKFL